MEEFKLGPFLGENNRLPDYRLATMDGVFVRAAVNVDISQAGTFKRRKGCVKVLEGTDCHSLWADGSHRLFMDYDTLYRVTGKADSLGRSALLAGLPPGQRMCYTSVNGEVYCSNGQGLWRISDAGITDAVIPMPAAQPTLSATAGGSLTGGTYQVALTFVSVDGEQSAATHPVSVEVPAGSSIVIEDIPQQSGCLTALYVSDANSTILNLVASTHDSVFTLPLWNYADGEVCRMLGLQPMPPGQIVAYLNGCLYVASGNVLYRSEPYLLGLCNPVTGYIPFPEPIAMVVPCQNGLYLSADQTYWIAEQSAELIPVLPYRAIFGTAQLVPNQAAVWWMSERGAVLGSPSGEVKNLQEDTVAVDTGTAGASMFREQDGLKQMVATLFGPQQTVMAASSYIDAEVVRKGTIL